MTSIKSFVSLNRPWAYIFWSDHEFVIALNFHVLYWWSLHCTTAYNAAFLLILTFLKLIRLIAPSFVWFIHSFMSFIHAFVRSFCSSSGGSSEGARTSHPPPPPPPPPDLTLFETEILTLLLHYFEREAEKLMKNLVDNLKQNPSGNWAILIFSGQKSCTRII